jgi:hypothetical protein
MAMLDLGNGQIVGVLETGKEHASYVKDKACIENLAKYQLLLHGDSSYGSRMHALNILPEDCSSLFLYPQFCLLRVESGM